MKAEEKLYQAMIWPNGDSSSWQRVSVYAGNLSEARKKIETEHGTTNVFDLHNLEDAENIR